MKSRTEILVSLAEIQAVPIAVIAWYRLHRYAWYRYSAIVRGNTKTGYLLVSEDTVASKIELALSFSDEYVGNLK